MLERVKGIEPSYEAWEASVLPLNYTRARGMEVSGGRREGKGRKMFFFEKKNQKTFVLSPWPSVRHASTTMHPTE